MPQRQPVPASLAEERLEMSHEVLSEVSTALCELDAGGSPKVSYTCLKGVVAMAILPPRLAP
jgi:hypothetical protein